MSKSRFAHLLRGGNGHLLGNLLRQDDASQAHAPWMAEGLVAAPPRPRPRREGVKAAAERHSRIYEELRGRRR